MKVWPASLQSRLMIMIFLALLLANALTLSLLLYERMSSARSVMLGNLEYDVATSVAILDRLPAQERPHWLARLARGNYRYQLSAGQTGDYPTSWRTRDAVRSLQEALSGRYPVSIIAVPGPREHIQAHVTLRDGAPLSIDLWPKLPAIARWLPLVLVAQFLLLLFCAWYAVRQVVSPMTRFTRAIDTLQPATPAAGPLAEKGPQEVQRARILAAISHDLQTPITRMKLRVEMADQPALRDKLLQDLDSMTRLVREGIALARSAEPLAEAPQRMSLNALLDSIACDYADIGKAVSFRAGKGADVMTLQPQALRRIMSNLIDNGLKYAEKVEISLSYPPNGDVIIHVVDDGPGIPEGELTAVLQPFYRLEQSRNRDTGGTGLGLAIAAQLAGQMQGSLTLHNLQQSGLEARVRLNAAVLYPSVSIPTADKSIY
ncbi:sensor histidine kinase [Klebsiella aerogenes]|uniref:sensor histidine kinase n=1 Tax=Klebsiella aerogenes TaxID=548 RepID=UPI002DBBE752|nr:ATP-binding protein [Klebsiella aerogenes]MEB6107330.1 ATP-binding protein [Klebsiella aerogenes]